MSDAPGPTLRNEAKSAVFGVSARVLSVGLVAILMVGCAGKSTVDPRIGVAASPKVVEEGEPVPKGGGEQVAEQPTGQPFQVAAKVASASDVPETYSAEGLASWYGSAFHGRMTANGEVFDMGALSAAHPSLPLPSYARVTNVNNGKSIVVRVNDRGPFHGERALDVSQRVAEILDFKNRGMAKVRIDYVGPASLKGSDDNKLMATYRENGHAASNIAIASLDGPSVAPGLYQQATLPSPAPNAPQAIVPQVNAPQQANPKQAQPQAVAAAAAPQPQPRQPTAQPVTTAAGTTPATTTPPVNIASRIDAGFGGMTSSQPLTHQGTNGMVSPVLSGFAFNPAPGGFR
jgi:rare lipoprotein A